MPAVLDTYARWDKRITTGVLNQWVRAIQRHTPPPRGAEIKFGSQVRNRPPKFLFFSSSSRPVPESYVRFVRNALREEFNLGGVPVRVSIKPKPKRGDGRRSKKKKNTRGQLRRHKVLR